MVQTRISVPYRAVIGLVGAEYNQKDIIVNCSSILLDEGEAR